MISDLPDEIVHQIFSLLPYLSLLRMVGVSRRLRSLVHSCPVVVFDQVLTANNCIQEQSDSFLNSACDSIQKREGSTKAQRFRLRVVASEERHDRIDRLVGYAINNCLGEVDLVIEVSSISFRCYPLSWPFDSVKSFTILKLSGFKLEPDDVVLILSCALLEDLTLRNCGLPTHTKVSSAKLKRLCLDLNSYGSRRVWPLSNDCKIEIDALNLHTFALQRQLDQCELDIKSCKSLRELSLDLVKLTDDWFQYHIDNLPALEILRCDYFDHVNISSSSLITVELRHLRTRGIINAPKLESLIYGHTNASGLDITRCRNLKSLHLDCIDLRHSLDTTICRGLKSLELHAAFLKDKRLQSLLRELVLLEDLKLINCSYIKCIEVSSLSLRALKVFFCYSLEKITLDAPMLESLLYVGNPCRHESIVFLHHTTYIKSLNLEAADVTDEWLEAQLSKLVLLEDLKLTNCCQLKCIDLSSSSLKRVVISYCINLKTIMINAPGLESFNYKGHLMRRRSIEFLDYSRFLKSLKLEDANVTDE